MPKQEQQKQEQQKQQQVEVLDALEIHAGAGEWTQEKVSYGSEIKEQALQEVLQHNKTIPAVAKELHVSTSAIARWLVEAREEIQAYAAAKDLADVGLLDAVKNELVTSINKEKIDKAGVRDIAVAYGILADKRALLLGKSSNSPTMQLRVAWKGGEGAVEVRQGQN
jgi:transposase-like protein